MKLATLRVERDKNASTYLFNPFGAVVFYHSWIGGVNGSVEALPRIQGDGVFVPGAHNTQTPMGVLDQVEEIRTDLAVPGVLCIEKGDKVLFHKPPEVVHISIPPQGPEARAARLVWIETTLF